MPDTRSSPSISVIIPTFNRALLLGDSLESLVHQTLPASEYEVLVVDDGSTDETPVVCRRFEDRLPLRYFRIGHAGIAAAKNIGIFSAAAPILHFFDDDDVAHADLLRQHVIAHRRWPEETAAVLGYTTWAPWLEVTELMHYVTDVGQWLFSYPSIDAGRALDFTYFWGGRSSCKRSFLARHGAFRQDFDFGCEDIELGYRLRRFGLTVHYEPSAISYMNRGITLEEFCRRCERQGRAQFVFSRIHRDPVIQEYCGTVDATAEWALVEPQLPDARRRLEAFETDIREAGTIDGDSRAELHGLFGLVFKACKLKGIVERATADAAPAAVRANGGIRTTPMPVFVIGSPRSGTTTLGLALGQHSQLWVSGESYFLWNLFGEDRAVHTAAGRAPAAAAAFEDAIRVSASGWLNQEGTTRQEFLAYLGLGVNAMFSQRSRGRRWVDQTPHYVHMADMLAEMFPDARFLHILRDGRSTVHSMLHFQQRKGAVTFAPAWAGDFDVACTEWSASVTAGVAFQERFPSRCLTVRHERFADDPRATLAEVFRFVAVPFEEPPVTFALTERLNTSFPAGRPLRAIPLDEWTRAQRERFRALAGDAAVRAGVATRAQLDAWVEGSTELESARCLR